ncbi:MAG: RING finger protein [Methylomonas sp.]|jgi:hypothetical protein|uniref:hypothetical protein n=1 Tax=Methylomonas sp. TaxID=418 RepID=UPI0025CE12C5|nr:hypothetical protein [Methylomonas sp.]MCK9607568.1 RING finger protein [Methylomonas sp.]
MITFRPPAKSRRNGSNSVVAHLRELMALFPHLATTDEIGKKHAEGATAMREHSRSERGFAEQEIRHTTQYCESSAAASQQSIFDVIFPLHPYQEELVQLIAGREREEDTVDLRDIPGGCGRTTAILAFIARNPIPARFELPQSADSAQTFSRSTLIVTDARWRKEEWIRALENDTNLSYFEPHGWNELDFNETRVRQADVIVVSLPFRFDTNICHARIINDCVEDFLSPNNFAGARLKRALKTFTLHSRYKLMPSQSSRIEHAEGALALREHSCIGQGFFIEHAEGMTAMREHSRSERDFVEQDARRYTYCPIALDYSIINSHILSRDPEICVLEKVAIHFDQKKTLSRAIEQNFVNTAECVICYTPIAECEFVAMCTSCGNTVCDDCLEQIRVQPCPICRGTKPRVRIDRGVRQLLVDYSCAGLNWETLIEDDPEYAGLNELELITAHILKNSLLSTPAESCRGEFGEIVPKSQQHAVGNILVITNGEARAIFRPRILAGIQVYHSGAKIPKKVANAAHKIFTIDAREIYDWKLNLSKHPHLFLDYSLADLENITDIVSVSLETIIIKSLLHIHARFPLRFHYYGADNTDE